MVKHFLVNFCQIDISKAQILPKYDCSLVASSYCMSEICFTLSWTFLWRISAYAWLLRLYRGADFLWKYLIELHVLLTLWNGWYSSVWPSIFCAAFRVMPDSTITSLRIDVENQLGYDNIPRDFVFLKCVGRCFTVVNTHSFWLVDNSSHSFVLLNCFVIMKFY